MRVYTAEICFYQSQKYVLYHPNAFCNNRKKDCFGEKCAFSEFCFFIRILPKCPEWSYPTRVLQRPDGIYQQTWQEPALSHPASVPAPFPSLLFPYSSLVDSLYQFSGRVFLLFSIRQVYVYAFQSNQRKKESKIRFHVGFSFWINKELRFSRADFRDSRAPPWRRTPRAQQRHLSALFYY